MIQCRLCKRTPNEVKGILHRVNEKGVEGVWECRPICGAEMSQSDAVVAAVEGWFDNPSSRVKEQAEYLLAPCIGKVKPETYGVMVQSLVAALAPFGSDTFCTLAKPGRGDCEHYIGLPSVLDETTTDEYGRPRGWCAYCWQSYRLTQTEQQLTGCDYALRDIFFIASGARLEPGGSYSVTASRARRAVMDLEEAATRGAFAIIESDPNFRIENWPLHDVLFQMAKWLKHLNDTHDCDCHGWETRSFLISAALMYQDQVLNASASVSPRQYAERIVGTIFDHTAASSETLKQVIIEAIESTETSRRVSWKLTHERDAELLKQDGWMCEQHPGREFPHDDCAGPGMPWIVEGKEAIRGVILSHLDD